MEIKNWTQYIDRGSCVGVVSGVKYSGESSRPSPPDTDTVVISEEARQAAMVAEMEKDGLSHEAAQKLASGRLTIAEPDWETFQVPVLQVQAPRAIYDNAYHEAYTDKLAELTARVEKYYAPEFSKIQDMDSKDALEYLFKTYKQPWMEDMSTEGAEIPSLPDGMTKDEASMAYEQLKSLYLNKEISVLRDPYALGTEGIEQLDNIGKYAQDAAQKAYDAAQKECDEKQEAWKARQKERYKQIYQNINNGNSTCMGYMALRRKSGSDESVG